RGDRAGPGRDPVEVDVVVNAADLDRLPRLRDGVTLTGTRSPGQTVGLEPLAGGLARGELLPGRDEPGIGRLDRVERRVAPPDFLPPLPPFRFRFDRPASRVPHVEA